MVDEPFIDGCRCGVCDEAFPEVCTLNANGEFVPVKSGEEFKGWRALRFIVCPACGNKRCPHAHWHMYKCTGSNEPGQLGSLYD